MSLATKTIQQLQEDQVSAIQAKAAQLTDFSTGSVLLALIESNTSVALWMQALLLELLATARLTTSKGADVDSFIADFGLTRLPAVAATGSATFSRYTSTSTAIVPANDAIPLIETANGSVQFAVTIDKSNPDYSSTLGGYVMDAGISSITVPIKALSAGGVGNVGAGVISVISSPIIGVDAVINAEPLVSGQDGEPDASVKKRFVDYLAGLAKASVPAIQSVIENLQAGIEYKIVEHIDYVTGQERKGYFYTIIDDRSGNPPQSLLSTVTNAIDATRACGIRFEVHPPEIIEIVIKLEVTKVPGADTDTVKSAVESAIVAYVNNLNMGDTLRYSRLIEVAYDASTDVENVTNLRINNETNDITSTNKQSIQVYDIIAEVD